MTANRGIVKWTIAASILVAIIGYNNCGRVPNSQTQGTTGIGNPITPPVSVQILQNLCARLNQCFPQSIQQACQISAQSTSGFETAFKLPATFTTYSSIIQGEATSALSTSTAGGSACASGILQLSCTSSAVQNAFVPTSTSPYAGTPGVVGAVSACGSTFIAAPTIIVSSPTPAPSSTPASSTTGGPAPQPSATP